MMVSLQAIQLLVLNLRRATCIQIGDLFGAAEIEVEMRAQAARIIGAGCEVMA